MNDNKLQYFKDAIVGIANPIKIILFGSRARGIYREKSDYDFLVVVDNGVNARAVYKKLNIEIRRNGSPLDFVVNDLSDFESKSKKLGSVVYDAVHEGVELYARKAA
jgi:predicted nucleotidyltransferase